MGVSSAEQDLQAGDISSFLSSVLSVASKEGKCEFQFLYSKMKR